MNQHDARRLIEWQQMSRAAYARKTIGDMAIPRGWLRPMSDGSGRTWIRMISLGVDVPTAGACCTITDLYRTDWSGSVRYQRVKFQSFLSAQMSERAFLADVANHISVDCTPVAYLELEQAARARLSPDLESTSPFGLKLSCAS